MNFFPIDRLLRPLHRSFQAKLVSCLSYLQHLLMRVAVAISLKLCLFTARVLLGTSSDSGKHANQF